MTLAIEQVESAVFLQNLKFKKEKKYALVFKRSSWCFTEAVALCDGCIETTISTKHSLNIAVSAGIVVWDLFKQFNN
jgi:tRNA C32,U32 (ribose-2'-O)-methylase TrmJ